MNVIEALSDSRFFRLLFKDLRTWHAWEIFLKSLFAIPLEGKKELEVFRKCTGLAAQPKERPRESFVICGRRSGKSFMSSIISVYLATFRDWSQVLSPGERGWIFIVANDKAQARIIKQYISGILERTPHFRKLVSKDLAWEISLKNGVSIAIKTCNFRSIRGYTLLAAICEELAFWRSEESANPDKELLTALRPALGTIPDSLLLGISTPYSRSGVLYESFKKYHGQEGGPLIWKAPSTFMNPTLNKQLIEQAMAEDPASAQAEYMAEFRTDTEALFPLEMVEAAVIPGRFELPKIARAEYFGFLDPSGGRQDSFTIAIGHKDKKTKKVILDVIREQKPPFRPDQVIKEFSELLKAYKVSRVEGDRYGGEFVTAGFEKHGIKVRPSELSKSEIYLEFLPIMANGTVELLDNKKLTVQLTSLERRTRSGGKDQVDVFHGHDDLANSAAGACVLSNRKAERRGPNVHMWPCEPEEPPGLWEQFK